MIRLLAAALLALPLIGCSGGEGEETPKATTPDASAADHAKGSQMRIERNPAAAAISAGGGGPATKAAAPGEGRE